jgi:cobalamin biosynthesis protein CobD/CbiB
MRAENFDRIGKYIDFLIKLFEADIRKNDIEYGAALVYVGTTLSSHLFQLVERALSLPLIISSAVILLYVLGERRRIKEKYVTIIQSLLDMEDIYRKYLY